MKKLVRSCLTGSVSVVTAAAIALVPSVAAPSPHQLAAATPTARVVSLPMRLTAAVQPTSATVIPTLLADWLQRIVVPPSASAAAPAPEFPPAVVGTGIDATIKNIYWAVEPWVRYGFEVAAYAVGWIPYVGWLSGQVMIFYNLGERIVRSITFNIADWLGGSISFGQGLSNVVVDTINSFIYFANDELAFWLPPLPPIPPLPGGSIADPNAVTVVPEAVSANPPTGTAGTGGKAGAVIAAVTAATGGTAGTGNTGVDASATDIPAVQTQELTGPQGEGSEPAKVVQKVTAAPKSTGLTSAVRTLASLLPHPRQAQTQGAGDQTSGASSETVGTKGANAG